MKRMLVAIALVAGALPAGLGGATHCNSPIFLFSYNRTAQPGDLKLHSGAIACLTVGEDASSDIVYPGADTFFVRWILGHAPTSGTLSFAGVTTPLTFGPCAPLFGVISRGCYDSQEIGFDVLDSFTGGDAVATVCDPDGCEVHTYSTLA